MMRFVFRPSVCIVLIFALNTRAEEEIEKKCSAEAGENCSRAWGSGFAIWSRLSSSLESPCSGARTGLSGRHFSPPSKRVHATAFSLACLHAPFRLALARLIFLCPARLCVTYCNTSIRRLVAANGQFLDRIRKTSSSLVER